MEFDRPAEEKRAELLERAVAEDLALRRHLDPPERRERPSYGEIYRAAALGDPGATARVRAAAREDMWVSRCFGEIMARDALAVFGEVRAAHSGDVFHRQAGRYRIEIRNSKTKAERCFLIVTWEAGAAPPSTLAFHPAPGKPEIDDLELPSAAEDAIQVILPRDHPAVAAAQDPERNFHLA